MDNINSIPDLPLWSDNDCHKLFIKLCNENHISPDIIYRLIKIMREYQAMERPRGINEEIESILNYDWENNS